MKVLALSNSDTEDGNGRFSLLTKAEIAEMSEVNYRRNGMKYSTTGKCWGVAPKAGGGHGVTALLAFRRELHGRSRVVSGGR